MTPESAGDPELRFDATPDADAAAPACARCRRGIEAAYYDAGGAIVCEGCKSALEAEAVAGSAGGRLSRALLYGLGGAVAGAVLYYAILALTGYEIGLVAIAVGWMVGRAVQIGSRHRGGRIYQAIAVGLTYIAIVSTYIPYIVGGIEEVPVSAGGAGLLGLAMGIGMLLVLAMAAPFLAGLENIVGLLIIGFALWQAWQMNRRVPLVITGPYAVGGARAMVAGES
ncbi:MAG TPA: hypothetical protein VF037_02085 [Gemmatimonadales bacterium]